MLLNHAEKTTRTKPKSRRCPPTICRTPAGPIWPKSTERGEPEPRGPRTTIPPPHSKSQGTVEREPLTGDLKPPKPRNETPATADHLHGKTSKLALFNIKLFLKKEDNILHIPNESN